MDGVLADFVAKWERLNNKKIDPVGPIASTPWGFYRDLNLIDGAKDAVLVLNAFFDIYFLSTPEWDNPSSFTDKRIWIEQNFGEIAHKKLILSHNKALNVGKYLIDDRIINGTDAFSGEFIHFGSEQFPDWKSVVDYILKQNNITIVDYISEVIDEC